MSVQVGPASLHKTYPVVMEEGDRAQQKIRVGEEVGVKDCDKLRLDARVRVVHGARLEALAVGASDDVNVGALLAHLLNRRVHHRARLRIRRIVEDLHLETLARPIYPASKLDDACGNVGLIEHWQLDDDSGQRDTPLPFHRVTPRRLPPLPVQQRHALVEDGAVEEVELVDSHEAAGEAGEPV